MGNGWIIGLVVLGLLCIVLAIVALITRGDESTERARIWAQIVAPILTIASIAVAGFVAYRTFLTPFDPVIVARPFAWLMGPVTPETRSLNVVIWITVTNNGATAGNVQDLAVRTDLPKGKWVLEPIGFVKSEQYYQMLITRGNLQMPPVEGPFTPIPLPAKSLVTKAVLFSPFGPQDFDPQLAEPGSHDLSLFVRYGTQSFPSKT